MAARNKKFERLICIHGQSILQQATDKSLPNPFTPEEISAAMQKAKPMALGYDQIHIEFMKNLGPKAHVWLSSSSSGSRQFIPFEKCGERPKRLLWTNLVRIEISQPATTQFVCVQLFSVFHPPWKTCSAQTKPAFERNAALAKINSLP